MKLNFPKAFVEDLLRDSTGRGVTDVTHTVAAVASSSSKSSADSFVQRLQIPQPCATYGSYAEAVNDAGVQVIYIATPHSHHFQHAMLALEAGKHVLCEKAFTVNAAQAKILCETAMKKGLFLMEAVWTRYFPLSIEVRRLVQTGAIGEVLRVISDLSIGDEPETTWNADHRMINKDLAGGALLDCKCDVPSIYY
jgi:predicted dehydrogenase